mgnify:FL=1
MTAEQMLAAWDRGGLVASIEMGGMGPGYEQALQVCAMELLHTAIAGQGFDEADLNRLDKEKVLGLSGAQAGAARWLAKWWLDHGDGQRPEGREIFISKRWVRS